MKKPNKFTTGILAGRPDLADLIRPIQKYRLRELAVKEKEKR